MDRTFWTDSRVRGVFRNQEGDGWDIFFGREQKEPRMILPIFKFYSHQRTTKIVREEI